MNDVIRLTDLQFDYLKKLVADDIQKKIAEKDHDGTFSRADLLLNLIKIHALERRESKKSTAFSQELEEDEPVESVPVSNEPIVKKVCKKCGKGQPLDSFPKNKLMKDGRASMCKSCQALYQQERYNKRKGKV